MEKEKKLTEVVKNSTILTQHRKRKEREDSSRGETVTVFCCGCDCTIACDKLQESDWDKEDHSHCKDNLLSVQFLHGPHKLGPEHKPWPDSTAYRAAPGNRPGASMGMSEKMDPGSQNCFQSCSRGLTRMSIKTTKTSQFYAGLWEFLQLQIPSGILKISFFASIFRCGRDLFTQQVGNRFLLTEEEGL